MKTKLFYFLSFIVLTIFSCSEKWFEVKPKGQADISTFANKKGIEDLLIGVYSCIDGAVGGNEVSSYASSVSNWLWGSVSSDDAYKGSGASSQFPMNAVEQYTLEPFNAYLEQHWINLYDGPSRANDVLKVLELVEDMSENEKKIVEAQVKFLRAHFYFELTIVHGKVPYIDEHTENPSHVPNDRFLWPEIESDLLFAVNNLPEKWSDKGRATKWAAQTFLARVYMFQKKFVEAKPLLDDVYKNGGFKLMDSYEQNYLIDYNNNEESIFEIQYVTNDFSGSPNSGWGDAGAFPPASAGLGTCCGYFKPSHSLVSAYRVDENGLPFLNKKYSSDDILPHSADASYVSYELPVDPRLDHTVGRPGVPYLDWGIQNGAIWAGDVQNGGPYLYKKNMFKKSERALANNSSWAGGLNPNNFRKYRLGHVILWLAECEAEIGSVSRAVDLVNEIRDRAKKSNVVRFDDGIPAAIYKVEPYPDNYLINKNEVIEAVRHEIRIEFAMEGLRFFDLVRWNIADEVLNNYLDIEGKLMIHLKDKKFVAGKHEYAPIPQREIDISIKDGEKVLKQNPGY